MVYVSAVFSDRASVESAVFRLCCAGCSPEDIRILVVDGARLLEAEVADELAGEALDVLKGAGGEEVFEETRGADAKSA